MRTREEQIAHIEEFCGCLGISHDSPNAETIERWLVEAEQRVRAEYAADTRRLEWLERLPFADVRRLPNGWEIRINNVRHWDVHPTLREAIDAAMETK